MAETYAETLQASLCFVLGGLLIDIGIDKVGLFR